MFRKWVEIENSYREKYIYRAFLKCPELYKETFVVTEKIDGANFSLLIKKNSIQYAKRSDLIDGSFFNYQAVFTDMKSEYYDSYLHNFIKNIQTFYCNNEEEVQLVGELFGLGIQKRVYYGPGKYWRWYATRVNNKLLSVKEEENFIESVGYNLSDLVNIRVPEFNRFTIDSSLVDEIAKIDLERDTSLYQGDSINTAEGVVIRPYNDHYIGDGQPFIIKHKHPKFKDQDNTKSPKVEKVVSSELQNTMDVLLSYVCENRTADLFSKHGEMEEPKQLGEYIKYYLQDIYGDFNKVDACLFTMKKDDKKWVNSRLTKKIVGELNRCL